MHFSRLKIALLMTGKEILRNRIVLLLFFLIPLVFYLLTVITTKTAPMMFQLAAVPKSPTVLVNQREAGIVFIGLTSVALLAAFVCMFLIQKNTPANRRLILCGFSQTELILAKLLVMLAVLLVVSVFIAAVSLFFLRPAHFLLMCLGFLLMGYVYGSYGLVVGSIFKKELEGILFVVLLVNIDVGWLQNPIYYEGAQNKAVIRHLPAFFPSQVSMIGAFSDFSLWSPALKGMLYGTLLLLLAWLFFRRKTRIFSR